MRYTLFLVLYLFTGVLFAQSFDITGSVLDTEDNSPVVGAYIYITGLESPLVTTTDYDGNFIIEISSQQLDSLKLNVSHVGFRKFSLDLSEKLRKQQHDFKILIEPDVLEEVVIMASNYTRPQNDFAAISTKSLNIQKTEAIPGGFNDLGRMVQNFAGVQRSNDASNEIVVRGNQPSSVLWRIDGIDVPNPNHFSEMGSGGGALSLLNTNTVFESDFYTGAFPAEFGNSTGAAFDVRLKRGRTDNHHFLGQLGFNGFEAMVDGPFKKGGKASYLVNYRNSNLTLIDELNLIDFDVHMGVPTFNDFTLKVDVPTTKAGSFSLFALGGKSDISTEASRIIAKTDASLEAIENAKDESKDQRFGSLTGIFGFNHAYLLTNNTIFKTNLAFTRSESYNELDTLDQNYLPHPNQKYQFRDDRISGGMKMKHYTSKGDVFQAGFNIAYISYESERELFDATPSELIRLKSQNGDSYLTRGFVQYKLGLFDDLLSLSPGLHLQYFAMNSQTSFEPRMSATLQINEKNSVNAGFGKHSQLLPLNYYFDEVYSNQSSELKFIGNTHYVLGHQLKVSENLSLNSELYYQKLSDVPINANYPDSWSMINVGALPDAQNQPIALSSKGEGRNFGVDVSIEQKSIKGWTGMITGSIFQSTYLPSDQVKRQTAWSGNYLLNAFVSKEIKLGKGQLNATLKFNLTGGKRYTPIDLEASRLADRTVYNHELDFSEKYPDYMKLDFRLAYSISSNRFSHEIGLDLQNITNRKNVLYNTYSSGADDIITVNQLNFYPVVQYRLYFD